MSKAGKDDKKLFTHPRWHEPIGGNVIGKQPMTAEEKQKAHEETIAIAKSMGYKPKGKQ
jgi:hypothetical protein